jgi:hypothetical protein
VDLFLIPPLKGGFNPIPSLALPLKGRVFLILLYRSRSFVQNCLQLLPLRVKPTPYPFLSE